MPVEPFRRAVETVLRERAVEVLAYGPTAGYGPLRETIAAADASPRARRAMPTTVLVTNGAQQAHRARAARRFLERGDAVAVEEPTYTGALSVLSARSARASSACRWTTRGCGPICWTLALERHRPRAAVRPAHVPQPDDRA